MNHGFRKTQVSRVLFLLIVGVGRPLSAQDQDLQAFRKFASRPAAQLQLQEIVTAGMLRAFGETPDSPLKLDPWFERASPVFVTLKKGSEIRGCMGTLQSRESSLAQEIQVNLRKALFQDPWHRRVQQEELPGMEVYLTAVGRFLPVRSIGEISPAYDGAYIRQGGKEAVVLPGEAKTQRYLLAFLKAKAGIKQGPYQLFRFKTETIRVAPDPAQISKSS